jgi:hypothetical protein
MERLLNLKRIYMSMGLEGSFDTSWSWPGYNEYTSAYLDGVCDWSEVLGSEDLTLPSCTTSVSCH